MFTKIDWNNSSAAWTKYKSLSVLTWCLLFVSIFVVCHFTAWLILRISNVSHGGPFFIDLRYYLVSADCAALPGVAIYSENCGHVNGSWVIRTIQSVGLGEAQSYTLGWIFLIAFSILLGCFVATLAGTAIKNMFLAVIVLTSPPILLLVERANIDILIAILLAFCALSVSRGWIICAIWLVIVASVFKFYPAPLLIWLAFLSNKWRQKLIAGLSIPLVGFQIIYDLNQMTSGIPKPTFVAFGNLVFGYYLEYFDYSIHLILQHGLGLLLLLFCFILINILEKCYVLSLPKNTNVYQVASYTDALFVIFSFVFLACYFTGMSYDYRLIFLFVPALILVSRTEAKSSTSVFLAALLFTASWGSWNFVFQPIGDVAIALWCAVLLRCLYSETMAPIAKLKRVFSKSGAPKFDRR